MCVDVLQKTFEHGRVAEMLTHEYERVLLGQRFLAGEVGVKLVLHMPVQFFLYLRVEIVGYRDLAA
jgi:hypothetical protein